MMAHGPLMEETLRRHSTGDSVVELIGMSDDGNGNGNGDGDGVGEGDAILMEGEGEGEVEWIRRVGRLIRNQRWEDALEEITTALEGGTSGEDVVGGRIGGEEGETLLHVAARAGAESVVEVLLAAGADPNARNGRGETPLHHAAWRGSVGAVEALLDAGASRDYVCLSRRAPRDLVRASNILPPRQAGDAARQVVEAEVRTRLLLLLAKRPSPAAYGMAGRGPLPNDGGGGDDGDDDYDDCDDDDYDDDYGSTD